MMNRSKTPVVELLGPGAQPSQLATSKEICSEDGLEDSYACDRFSKTFGAVVEEEADVQTVTAVEEAVKLFFFFAFFVLCLM